MLRAGRCAVVQKRQDQTWNLGLRPSCMANKQPVFDFVPHCYPSTTEHLIHSRPDPTQASVPPWVSPPGFMADLSQLSWTGTHSLGFDKGWFHGTDWEVLKVCVPPPPLQHYRVLSLFSVWSTQAGGQQREGQSTEEYQKRRKPNISLSTSCIAPVPCHSVRRYMLDLSHWFKTHF